MLGAVDELPGTRIAVNHGSRPQSEGILTRTHEDEAGVWAAATAPTDAGLHCDAPGSGV